MLANLRLRDGRVAHIRQLTMEDGPQVEAFVAGLSPQSRYARFFSAVTGLTPQQLGALLAGRSVGAFAADGRLVAHAQYVLAGAEAELAVVVSEAWRRNRMGEALLGLLKENAAKAGAQALSGLMLADNQAMRRLASKLGFALTRSADATLLRFELKLLA